MKQPKNVAQRFDEARVGDLVYSRIFGCGKVMYVGCREITVSLFCGDIIFNMDGRYSITDAEPTLFYRDKTSNYLETRPVPKVPWDKVPVDTKVLLDEKDRRYFSHCQPKRIFLFNNGATSWATNYSTGWSRGSVQLAEDITIDGTLYPAGSK